MTPSLRTENLTIRFGGHAAVNGVTCAFVPGELTAIVGPNGAGKTTWFNLVSGQLKPTEGRIFLGDRDITGLSPSARAKAGVGRVGHALAHRVSFRFQSRHARVPLTAEG